MIPKQTAGHHGNLWGAALAMALITACFARADPPVDALMQAAQRGEPAGVKAALGAGADVNARSPYGATALTFAAEKGHLDVVKLLIERGADVNVRDQFFSVRPINWAAREGHADVVEVLLTEGSVLAPELLEATIARDQMDVARAIIESGKAEPAWLERAMQSAQMQGNKELIRLLESVGVSNTDILPTYRLSAEELKKFEGTYVNVHHLRMKLVANVEENTLTRLLDGTAPVTWRPVSPVAFQVVELPDVKINFTVKDGRAAWFDVLKGNGIYTFSRVTYEPPGAITDDSGNVIGSSLAALPEDNEPVKKAEPWPAFRGPRATGVADGQHPPVSWDIETGHHVAWKTPIPGLAHSSPVVWGDRVFVTTAISADPDPVFRPGLYGDVDSADDDGKQSWRVYCLDKRTGRVLWHKVAHEGVPRSRRHIKASHANATPATDGTHLVTSFGSEGLYCYDSDGSLQWKVDLGDLDAGWFYDRSYQWGHASSPIIYEDLVIVQADHDSDSFIAAYRLDNGKQVWRTSRDELPSWGTPTIFEHEARTELVTNATKYVRGYDPNTGKELWRLGRNSEITVPTPVPGDGLVYVTAGYAPIRPVYAVKAGATGDISLEGEATSNEYVAWSHLGAGAYIPTPIAYKSRLYVLKNNGVVTCFHASSGSRLFRERVGGAIGSAFAASPVAADGRIYFTSEDGDIFVVRAGPSYELIAHNKLNEHCMATPAISDGMMFIRTTKHLYGIGTPGNKRTD